MDISMSAHDSPTPRGQESLPPEGVGFSPPQLPMSIRAFRYPWVLVCPVSACGFARYSPASSGTVPVIDRFRPMLR